MSKRQWFHPELKEDKQVKSTQAWRSSAELASEPSFVNKFDIEFPEGDTLTEEEAELSRRSFVKLMGASTALAGMGMVACRRPEKYIMPYKQAPEWVIPGKAVYYATAMPTAKGGVPLLASSHEGRPTKLESNTLANKRGGTDAFAQASILNLYSPDRSKEFLFQGQVSSQADFQNALPSIAAKLSDANSAFVVAKDDSPSRERALKQLKQTYPKAKFYAYEALEADSAISQKVVINLSKAQRILSLDADFLGLDKQADVAGFYANRFVEGADYDQKVDKNKINRLYVVEPNFSETGGLADHRMRLAPSQVAKLTVALGQFIAEATGDATLGSITKGSGVKSSLTDKDLIWAKEAAKDLVTKKGKSLVLIGSGYDDALKALVLAMNVALGATSNIIKALPNTDSVELGSLADLKNDLAAKKVKTLVWLSPANPFYDAPSDYKFEELTQSVEAFIHFGERATPVAKAATWHIPAAHYLESWGDVKDVNGKVLLIQPLILPLYEGISELELLLAFNTQVLATANETGSVASPAYDFVKQTSALTEAKWRNALKRGFIADKVSLVPFTVNGSELVSIAKKGLSALVKQAAPTGQAVEVVFKADSSVWDGRYINNAWLQEAPDPIVKLTWDNAAWISPKTAEALGVYDKEIGLIGMNPIFKKPNSAISDAKDKEGPNRTAPVIKLKVNGAELEIPVIIAFGQAENVLTLPVGYGQFFDKHRKSDFKKGFDAQKHAQGSSERESYVGVNAGFNVYSLRTSANLYYATGATVATTKVRYKLAMTQEHHNMYGRALAREVSTQGDFKANLHSVKKHGVDSHAPENISLYKSKGSKVWHGDGVSAPNLLSDKIHQWGMAIDLNVCTGCNACLVACQAENNIPVVGKEQVAMGREMHWIRMDRYYAVVDGADEDNPEMIPQPVACAQCESAPCETVCPVNATVHTEEGLNAMAYNRCIGTRYCANNCPYKARRFNFFDYNKRNPLIEKNLYKGAAGKKQEGDSTHLQRNPNVSVRMRGVMEKCTYCVQRLEAAKIDQKQALRSKVMASGALSHNVELKPEELRIKHDGVKVACQTACPSDAISFGNLLDKEASRMVRAKGSERNYDLLNYIGTLPRTSYLARVKNPNPAMPGAEFVGQATINMH